MAECAGLQLQPAGSNHHCLSRGREEIIPTALSHKDHFKQLSEVGFQPGFYLEQAVLLKLPDELSQVLFIINRKFLFSSLSLSSHLTFTRVPEQLVSSGTLCIP
jgi:hypothetical protein